MAKRKASPKKEAPMAQVSSEISVQEVILTISMRLDGKFFNAPAVEQIEMAKSVGEEAKDVVLRAAAIRATIDD